MKQPQHIPTLIGLFLLLVGLGGGIFLSENHTSLFSSAAADSNPRQVSITNISDTAVTINWITNSPTATFVKLAKSAIIGGSEQSVDIRDSRVGIKVRRVHSAQFANLLPQSGYHFTILSGTKEFTSDTFAFTTGATLAVPDHALNPSFGTLVDTQNNLVDEALVLASFDGSQEISTLVENGSWILPIGALRSSDNSRYFVPTVTDAEKIAFIHPTGVSSVTTTIDNASPLPPVQIGRSYEYVPKKTSGVIIAQAKTSVAGQSSSLTTVNTFQITSPKAGSGIPASKPAFKGVGTPDKSVILTISGNSASPMSDRVTISGDGAWIWVAKAALAPGTYTITAASFDLKDKPVVVSQEFTILKSGSQVLQAATPSASHLPSPSPTLAPSASASATSTPVPVTGNTETTVILLGFGILLLLFGGLSLHWEKNTASPDAN